MVINMVKSSELVEHVEYGVKCQLSSDHRGQKSSRDSELVPLTIPFFAEAQRVFGITDDTTDGRKLVLFLATKAGMRVSHIDVNRSLELKLKLKEAFEAHEKATIVAKSDKLPVFNESKFTLESVSQIMSDEKIESIANFRDWFNAKVVPEFADLSLSQIKHINSVLAEVEKSKQPKSEIVRRFI